MNQFLRGTLVTLALFHDLLGKTRFGALAKGRHFYTQKISDDWAASFFSLN